MTFRFAICDDDPAQRAYLDEAARTWAQGEGHSVSVALFPSAEAFLFSYEDNKACDILLLDIEMGGMSGVELARAVRGHDRSAQIIFVTGYMDYIAEGYDVEALHYLLKPVTHGKLFCVLDRAAARLAGNARVITLDLGGESVRVPIGDIRYMEARRNYVAVYAASEYTVRATLNEMEQALDARFYRAGRSFIVNLRCVRRVTKTDIHLADGTLIPLPRGQYDAVNRALIERL